MKLVCSRSNFTQQRS